MEWLACQVTTGKEYEIRKKILQKVPTAVIDVPRKYSKEISSGAIKNRSERILPGYLLIGNEVPINPFLLKDFIKVIGKVSEIEYDTIKSQEGQKDATIAEGAKVIVIDGPLQGCRGTIKKQNIDGTFQCRLTFHGVETEAALKLDFISSIK